MAQEPDNPQNRPETAQTDLRAGDLTDGRFAGEWRSRYPADARKQYFAEAAYVGTVSAASIALLFFTWTGWTPGLFNLSGEHVTTFQKYAYYAFAGMLGGTIFDIKFLYRVVARGYWNEDRRLWRILSPWLSLCVAFVFGAIIESGLIEFKWVQNGPGRVVLGFLVGYFSDSAVAKMHELAEVIFGPSKRFNEGKKGP